MAGKVLPLALAVVSGIAIGVSTFDGEFKEQRRRRFEEEYKKDVAAASVPNSEEPSSLSSSPHAPSALPTSSITEKAKTETNTASATWSSWLGLKAASPSSAKDPETKQK